MIEIIPAIDIVDGKCVRLTEGDYSRMTTYGDDPVETAKKYVDCGIRRLHLVDLDGARSGAVKNLHVLEKISASANLRIDFGGGIQTEAGLHAVFAAGATYATVGSIVVKNPDEFQRWIDQHDSSRFFIGADVRHDKIAVSGWQEQTDIAVLDFITQQVTSGVNYFFCTDISKDGKLEGPSIELYGRIIKACPGIRLVASGGVTTMDDVYRLEEIGCDGVIIGKAIYENRISLNEIAKFNSRAV
jgi:phosphoribosylformimino-5-aminoimidazole carboxamide ribotide isomerase